MPVDLADSLDERTIEIVGDLYQALRSAETYARYVADADLAGEAELAQYFRAKAEAERLRAERAKGLLKPYL